MRFNVLVAASFLATLASGLVIPSSGYLSERDLQIREIFIDEVADLLARDPGLLGKLNTALEPKYHVPAGHTPDKPAQTYSRTEVKQAVHDANTEAHRLAGPGVSNRSKKNSPLKNFNNNDHHVPKPFGSKNSLPHMTGPGKEYPLPNKNGSPGKGPARVIMQENKAGQLKLQGVVAHDQKRPLGTPGANDHFQVRPSINPFRKT